jgi:hypothetical protein
MNCNRSETLIVERLPEIPIVGCSVTPLDLVEIF